MRNTEEILINKDSNLIFKKNQCVTYTKNVTHWFFWLLFNCFFGSSFFMKIDNRKIKITIVKLKRILLIQALGK